MRISYLKQFVVFVLLLAFSATWALPIRALTADPGIDIAGMDQSVKPGDDFFGYANGGWMKATEIPADRTSFGAFDVIFDEVNKRTAGIITEAAKSKNPEERAQAATSMLPRTARNR